MNRGDRWLIVLPLALTAVGVIMVYSSSAILGITRYQDPNYFLSKQLFRTLLGIVVMIAAARVDLRRLEALAPIIMTVGVALLALVVVAGHMSNEAQPGDSSTGPGPSGARRASANARSTASARVAARDWGTPFHAVAMRSAPSPISTACRTCLRT